VGQLEIEQRRHPTRVEHELAGVAGHEGHAFAPGRGVAAQPAEHPLDHRLGSGLELPVVALPDREVVERQLLRRRRANQALRLERGGVDGVGAGEELDEVVLHRVALGLAPGRAQVGAPGHPLEQHPERLRADAVDVGHRHVVGLQHPQNGRLVLERVDAVDPRLPAAVAPPVEGDRLAVAQDVEEPRRSPARLPLGVDDRSAEGRLHPVEGLAPTGRELLGERHRPEV
jgi:hypothetical protein